MHVCTCTRTRNKPSRLRYLNLNLYMLLSASGWRTRKSGGSRTELPAHYELAMSD